FRRATWLEHVYGFGVRGAQYVERRTLRVGCLHHLGDALERPIRQLRGIIAANLRGASLVTVRPRSVAAGARAGVRAPAGVVSVRSAAMGVRTVDAVVDVVICIGPKVVIGIRPEYIIGEIVIGVRPEQRSEPAGHEPAPPPGPSRAKEPAVKAR